MERGAQLGREQFRFLPGGKVTALVDLVVVDEGGVGLLDPAAWRRDDLARKCGEGDRDRNGWRSLTARVSCGLCCLPVRAGRRGAGAGQPVERDVVEDVVSGE